MTNPGANFRHSAYDTGANGNRILGTTDRVDIFIRDARHERTGIHGRAIIALNEKVLGYHSFNLEKDDERDRFARRCWKRMDDGRQSAYPETELIHDLDIICNWVITSWETDRLTIDTIGDEEHGVALSFPIYPYLLEGAGSIMFAPPGSGKSYIALVMAMCIANGLDKPFESYKRPVLYVNLERPRNTFVVRDRAVRNALGLDQGSNVTYLHGRGFNLRSIVPKLKEYAREHPDAVVFLDSVSRTGLGTLLDDTTANQFTDMMNEIGLTWLGIGHTPRGDDKHVFGSVHFTAGCDIEIRLVSAEQGKTLTAMLETVKSNDGPLHWKTAVALEFGETAQEGLVGVRRTTVDDNIAIASQSTDEVLRISQAIAQLDGEASPTMIQEVTGIKLPNISSRLQDTSKFVFIRRDGRNKLFGLKAHAYPDNNR